jgi:hypothetical protein
VSLARGGRAVLVAPALSPGRSAPRHSRRLHEPPHHATSVPWVTRGRDEAIPLSDGWLPTGPVSSRSRTSCQVTRRKARPLRPISRTEAPCRGTCCKNVLCRWSFWLRCRPPAPYGWWSLARSSPTSRVLRRLAGTALLRVRLPNGSFLRRASACADIRRVRPARTELPLEDAG